VVHEREELATRLGVPGETVAGQAAAVGAELGARARAWIAEEPVHFARLLGKKTWLMLGNDELSQDYDFAGERELLGWSLPGLPFGLLLGVAAFGGCELRRRVRNDPGLAAFAVVLVGQLVAIVAANLVFFTSSQHRLPLAIPCALLAAPAWERLARPLRGQVRVAIACITLAALLFAQGLWPRRRAQGPSAEHYYNLALVQDWIGEPVDAVRSLDRAIAVRPQTLFFLARAGLHRRLGAFDAAEADLEVVVREGELPAWATRQLGAQREALAVDREVAAQLAPASSSTRR
jgi:hypothetical protein